MSCGCVSLELLATRLHCPHDFWHKMCKNMDEMNTEYRQKVLSVSMWVSNPQHKWALIHHTCNKFYLYEGYTETLVERCWFNFMIISEAGAANLACIILRVVSNIIPSLTWGLIHCSAVVVCISFCIKYTYIIYWCVQRCRAFNRGHRKSVIITYLVISTPTGMCVRSTIITKLTVDRTEIIKSPRMNPEIS